MPVAPSSSVLTLRSDLTNRQMNKYGYYQAGIRSLFELWQIVGALGGQKWKSQRTCMDCCLGSGKQMEDRYVSLTVTVERTGFLELFFHVE